MAGSGDVLAGARRILAVRLDNIGDVVMLGPALRALRAALPGATITLLAAPAGAQATPLLPWIDDVVTWRAVWQDASGGMPLDPTRELALVGSLGEGNFDVALVFTSFSQSPHPAAYACYLAGIPIRAGASKEFGGSVLSHPVPPPPDEVHQVDRNLHLVEALGVTSGEEHLAVAIPGTALARASELLSEAGIPPNEPFIAVAPAASCEARTYAPDRFAEVVAGLTRRAGMPAICLGTEKQAPLCRRVLGEAPGATLAGRTSVPELAAVLARAALVVTAHSGPVHLADAVGTPAAVLFSGTDLVSQWRPRRTRSRILRRDTACTPCYAFRCPYSMECLDLPAEEVVEASLTLLEPAPVPVGEDAA